MLPAAQRFLFCIIGRMYGDAETIAVTAPATKVKRDAHFNQLIGRLISG